MLMCTLADKNIFTVSCGLWENFRCLSTSAKAFSMIGKYFTILEGQNLGNLCTLN
jgi:hypothetical protein